MSSGVVWRARCPGGHCDIRTTSPTGKAPRDELRCKSCDVSLPWVGWEVTERVGYVAELFGWNGLGEPEVWLPVDKHGNRAREAADRGFMFANRQAALDAMRSWRGGKDGWRRRVRRVCVRRLVRVAAVGGGGGDRG